MKDVLKDIQISQIEMILNSLLFREISDMDLDIWKKKCVKKQEPNLKCFKKQIA